MVNPLDEHDTNPLHNERRDRKGKSSAATGASAASIRAFSAQFVAFYFRAPIKAFFRTRVDYMAFPRAIASYQISPNERWSWKFTTPGILAQVVREHGWDFIPKQVLPPLLANATIGAVCYTTYLQSLASIHDPATHTSKRPYPPAPVSATFTAGFAAGAVQSLVAAPLDALQVRFNTSDILGGKYTSMWSFAKSKLAEIGPRGVLAGLSLSFVKDTLGYGVFFATFETVKSQGYYEFVTSYYGRHRPSLDTASEGDSQVRREDMRPVIRPHFAMEPAFLLCAGVTASIAQQLIQFPLSNIQDVHYGRLESLDVAAKREPTRAKMLRLYYQAYQKTLEECSRLAAEAGGWRRWLYKDFFMSTLRQVPSTSAGLIVFELVRRRYATDADIVRISKDGFDILLS